ncbi:MAG: tetratricopeptide repeat protein [Gammaproteobacteria bacterium]|nr:tetratricopeptide repeat protein [Gammaproteobacteria bacterium]
MRLIILSALTLAAGVWLAQVLREDTGYVLMGMGHWTVEMSFVLFCLLGFVAIGISYYLLRTLSSIMRGRRIYRKWRVNKLASSASEDLSKGLLAQSEGQWNKAERALVKKAENSKQPVINYLEAAKAATAQGASDRAERYLKLAQTAAPRKDIAIELTRVELLLNKNNTDSALEILQQLRKQKPKSTRVLDLMAQAFKQRGEWDKIIDIIPDIRKHHALDLDSYLALEHETYMGLIEQAMASKDSQRIRQAWSRLPKQLQQDSELLYAYAQGLIELNESSITEPLLRQAIEKEWQPKLVYLYGLIKDVNLGKQIQHAERWLYGHEKDAVLLLTLARLNIQKQLWGKARSYLDASLGVEPTPETYYVLAQLLERINEGNKANEFYRKGLMLASQTSQYTAA